MEHLRKSSEFVGTPSGIFGNVGNHFGNFSIGNLGNMDLKVTRILLTKSWQVYDDDDDDKDDNDDDDDDDDDDNVDDALSISTGTR